MEVHSAFLSDLLNCSQVWITKLRQGGADLPPHEKQGTKYVYSVPKIIAWYVARQLSPLIERIEELERRNREFEAAVVGLSAVERARATRVSDARKEAYAVREADARKGRNPHSSR